MNKTATAGQGRPARESNINAIVSLVYVRDRVLVLFQKILSLFTIILPVLYNYVMAECFFL